jgi:hypothetical protein
MILFSQKALFKALEFPAIDKNIALRKKDYKHEIHEQLSSPAAASSNGKCLLGLLINAID